MINNKDGFIEAYLDNISKYFIDPTTGVNIDKSTAFEIFSVTEIAVPKTNIFTFDNRIVG